MAGGIGERMSLGHSKVMLRVDGKSLLEHCIEQTKNAGIKNIVILCDDIIYKECSDNVGLIENVKFYKQKECKEFYKSTFEILQEFLKNNTTSERILFEYGHAPRHSDLYQKMMSMQDDIVATQFNNSTRRDIIKGINGFFIEPPYIINIGDVIALNCSLTWAKFFDKIQQQVYCGERKTTNINISIVNAPNEFNNKEESSRYLEYVANKYLSFD
jgi:hypothetical protein